MTGSVAGSDVRPGQTGVDQGPGADTATGNAAGRSDEAVAVDRRPANPGRRMCTRPASCRASSSASRRGGGPLARNEKKPWNSPSTNRIRSAALIFAGGQRDGEHPVDRQQRIEDRSVGGVSRDPPAGAGRPGCARRSRRSDRDRIRSTCRPRACRWQGDRTGPPAWELPAAAASAKASPVTSAPSQDRLENSGQETSVRSGWAWNSSPVVRGSQLLGHQRPDLAAEVQPCVPPPANARDRGRGEVPRWDRHVAGQRVAQFRVVGHPAAGPDVQDGFRAARGVRQGAVRRCR